MLPSRLIAPALGVVALTVVACACASSEPSSDLELDLSSDEIRLELSEEVARSAVMEFLGSSLECDGEIDDGLRELLEELDRGGPRSRAVRRDGEIALEARRRGGRLDLEITVQGPGFVELTMPWAVAECLLGRPTSTDRAVTSAIDVKVNNPKGRDFAFTIQ